MGFSIFFNLNLCFFINSELITSSVAPLFNSTSTVIPSYISTLSKPIFTITFLSLFSLFRSQPAVLSITLLNTMYLLLRLNQGVLSLAPYLNSLVICFLLQLFSFVHCSHSYIPTSSLVQSSLLFPYFYSFLLSVQNLHNYNNFYCSYPLS